MTSYPRPRYNVNDLRLRVDEALRASGGKGSGPAPQVDNLTQATACLLMHGLSVSDVATVLDRSPGYVRVMKRKLVLAAGLASPKEAKKEKRRSASERSRLDVPDWDINELHALALQLRAAEDDQIVADGDIALARQLGRDDVVARINARADVASS